MVKSILNNYMGNYQEPILIYNISGIRKKMSFLSDICYDSPIKMLFAVKSFPYKEVIDLAYELMAGFEFSNLNECHLLPHDIKDVVISMNDPTGQINSLIPTELVNDNICYINMDFIDVAHIGSFNFHSNINYGVRISHTSLIGSTDSDLLRSRFGNQANTLNSLKEIICNNKINGIHVSHGSEVRVLDDYLMIIDKIFHILKKEEINISFINLGGLYKFKEREIENLVQHLIPLLVKHNMRGFFEPGRFISEDNGYALGKIVSIKKTSEDKYYLMSDLSEECHVKWSDPILMRKGTLYAEDTPHKLMVFVGRPTCYEHDCLGVFHIDAVNGKLPFEANEILAFSNISGYSAAWNTSFNGINKAKVVFEEM